MRHPALLTLLLLAFTARLAAAAEPALEFTGVLIFPNKTVIALREPAGGASKLLAPGGTFGDYTLVSYEPNDETVVVARGTETFRLTLREAKVQAAEPADLQKKSLAERRRVWELIKDLEGQALIAALIANDDREMRAYVEKTGFAITYLEKAKARMTDELQSARLTEEQKKSLSGAAAKLGQRMQETQSVLDQQASRAKAALRLSLGL